MYLKNKKQKKFTNRLSEGFTLIELLTVIAIIGILAVIIMVGLSDSQNKSKDSKVKSQMTNLRRVTELYSTSNNNTYGITTSSCTAGMFADTTSDVAKFVTTGNYPTGTTLTCRASSTAWAVSASLAGGGHWCTDYTGVNRKIASAITTTSCPAS